MGGISVPANKSWESWWDEEQEHLQSTGFLGRLWEIVLSLRFVIFLYGIVYHLSVSNKSKSITVVSMGRKKFSADFQLMFRLLKLFLFVGSIGTVAILFIFLNLTVSDIFASLLAFMPTGWALLQIAQACRPVVKAVGLGEGAREGIRVHDGDCHVHTGGSSGMVPIRLRVPDQTAVQPGIQ